MMAWDLDLISDEIKIAAPPFLDLALAGSSGCWCCRWNSVRIFTCVDTRETGHFGEVFALTDCSEEGITGVQKVDLEDAVRKMAAQLAVWDKEIAAYDDVEFSIRLKSSTVESSTGPDDPSRDIDRT